MCCPDIIVVLFSINNEQRMHNGVGNGELQRSLPISVLSAAKNYFFLNQQSTTAQLIYPE